MAATNRPLSPHLQIYRPQLTSVLSILHRVTGVFLSSGILVLIYWLSALSGGPDTYESAVVLLGSWPAQALLLAWMAAFYYHLLNGVRHLFWDAGIGFELRQVYRSGWMVLIGCVILTTITWFAIAGGGS